MARAQEVSANANVGVAATGNMQWHNGRWWYWQPSANHWMVYHNNQWFAPGADGVYRYPNGQLVFGSNVGVGTRYQSGYRGNYYDPRWNNYGYGNWSGNRYYGPYDNRYGYGNYGYRGYGNSYNYNRGANVGAAIGGAIGGQGGANVGAAIGGALNR
jgi:hypothetical protein